MKIFKIGAYLVFKSVGFLATLLLSLLLIPYEHIIKPLFDSSLSFFQSTKKFMHTAWYRAYQHWLAASSFVKNKYKRLNEKADKFFAKF